MILIDLLTTVIWLLLLGYGVFSSTACPTPNGDFPNPTSDTCTAFTRCVQGVPLVLRCPAGLTFDFFQRTCRNRSDVDCEAQLQQFTVRAHLNGGSAQNSSVPGSTEFPFQNGIHHFQQTLPNPLNTLSNTQSRNPLTQLIQSGALPQTPLTQLLQSGALPQTPLTQLLQSGALPQTPLTQLLQSGALPHNPLTQLLQSGALPQNPLTQLLQSGALPPNLLTQFLQSGAFQQTGLNQLVRNGTQNSLTRLLQPGVLPQSVLDQLLKSGALSRNGLIQLFQGGALTQDSPHDETDGGLSGRFFTTPQGTVIVIPNRLRQLLTPTSSGHRQQDTAASLQQEPDSDSTVTTGFHSKREVKPSDNDVTEY